MVSRFYQGFPGTSVDKVLVRTRGCGQQFLQLRLPWAKCCGPSWDERLVSSFLYQGFSVSAVVLVWTGAMVNSFSTRV